MLDTALVKAFRLPAGVLVELYATTLHYAPSNLGDAGFRVTIVLPRERTWIWIIPIREARTAI